MADNEKRRLKLGRRFRWVLLIVIAAIVCYLAAPRVVWLWRALRRIDAATAKASTVIGEPAADWQTIDFDGVPRSLTDYRGRVVVLELWFAHCGWCMRSMPQMVALANEFKDQPVAVLGVNWDKQLDDAQRVIDHFQIDYPTLRDEEQTIHQTYRVTMWPSVVVLDRDGVVRHVHCGYWPTMQRSLSKKIRELLDEDRHE